MSLLSRFDVILLEMNGTFMFGLDRFERKKMSWRRTVRLAAGG